MRRNTFDVLVSTGGLLLAVILLIAGGLLTWAHSFADNNVRTQLAAQKISFPDKGSAALKADPEITKYVTPYAGQSVTNGQQAGVFANHYIKVHLREIGAGKTYSQVSSEYIALSKTAKPADPALAKLATQRQTLFMGETLRGMLLNAYAFWKMGQIAAVSAIVSFVAAGLLLLLSVLGFVHSRRVSPAAEVLPQLTTGSPVTA